ncbi:ribonuclease P protein component [Sneathiella limimaris]|uniref:ribonuclease P protein component n=1 Tax=Sneathiella limimaris TaxID=1964213 RepID=UPI00146BFB76|nr:ribonuclease P protein component [Sneathiella limimaris]
MPKGVERLKKRADFLRVASVRCRWATPGIVLQAAPQVEGSDAGLLRVGFTATKKTGNAVKRNRIKRRLRALADDLLPKYGRPGTDYVLIGRQGTVTRDFQDLQADLVFALKKVNSMKSRDRNA